MNRMLIPMAGLSGALMPLVFDSSLKGAGLLAAAALTALALGRASAATRHLVWLVAVVALLVLPLLSWTLPQWRVLPAWAEASVGEPVQADSTFVRVSPTVEPAWAPPMPRPVPVTTPEAAGPAFEPAPIAASDPRPTPESPPLLSLWRDWLAATWVVGVVLLALRLIAAHLALRWSTRACRRLTARADDPIASLLDEARKRLGVTQPVTVLLDEKRTIPLVWGVIRPRLLLPAEARDWSEAQLRSVLLHELAHIKRRDPLVQWLTQIACALHWWNPLVWLAAWRVHIERERACDDLVLASGVRASAYAEHLLHVATRLSPARWTHACGLAMARPSSLEGRLLAVLSDKLNRRGVTRALTAAALILGGAIAIPVAMLRAAEEAWNPPQAAHIGTNDFSAYCVHHGTDVAFVIAYHGETSSSSTHDSNPETRTWSDSGTLTTKNSGIALSFLRRHTAPDTLIITTAPAGSRDLSQPPPPPREFGQKEYDLAQGRVFLLRDNGAVRQLDITAPVVRDMKAAIQLKEQLGPREVDWSQFPGYHNFDHPFSPEKALQLAAIPGKTSEEIRRLMFMILQASVEKSQELQPLLKDEELKKNDDGSRSLALALSAYDFSVNGNKEALRFILDELANGPAGDVQAAVPLGFIDEWDLTMAAHEKHFARGSDGAAGLASSLVWEQRRYLFPENLARFQTAALVAAKLDAESLRGVWEGHHDGVSVELRLGDDQGWEVKRGDTLIQGAIQTRPANTGKFLTLMTPRETEGQVPCGRLRRAESGALHLDVWPDTSEKTPYPRIRQLVLERQAPGDPPKSAGVTMDTATEAQLDWGEAVNGLRGAVIIRSPVEGKAQGVYLAVQNVSGAPLRFVDTVTSERLRSLYVSASGRILFALTNGEPTMTDVMLQPRETAFLSLLREDGDEVTAGMIEGIRKDSLQTWRAVLDIQQAPQGAWTGKLTTGETRGAVRTDGPQPKDKAAQALFKHWQTSARLNGDIPGGLVRLLHDKVKEFIRNNEPDASGGPFAQKMKPLETRFAHTGDWKASEIVTLLDDIAAAHTIPLETTLSHLTERTLFPGTPLPASLENANWGEPLPSGLRMAHVLEPRAEAYHLGTELKARILFHNAGREPVAFVTTTFQQPGHTAKRADGSELKLDSTDWLTRGRMAAYRLAPGEYCEIHTPGLGIGARIMDRDDWASVRAGSWILCEPGDEVVFTPGAAALSYREGPGEPADWWMDFITERLNREAPVPADTKEREYLLYRVVRDLYGTAPSTTQGDAFAADTSPDALKNLALLLVQHPYGKRSDGLIRPGTTKFRVLPPDPDAAKRPRLASGPGWYSLGENLKFSVTRRAVGDRAVNEANLIYFQQGQDNVVHNVPLPDGHDTWAAATTKGATDLWIAEAGTLRKYDFANPRQPAETRFDGDQRDNAPIPSELRAALNAVLSREAGPSPPPNQPAAPAAPAVPAPPARDVATPPATENAPSPTEPQSSNSSSKQMPPGTPTIQQAKAPGTYDLAKGVQLVVSEGTSSDAGGEQRQRAKVAWRKDQGAEEDAESLVDTEEVAAVPFLWTTGTTSFWILREDRPTWIDFSVPGSLKRESFPWHEAGAKVHQLANATPTASPNSSTSGHADTVSKDTESIGTENVKEALTLADIERILPKNPAGAYIITLADAYYLASDPAAKVLAGKEVEVGGRLVRSGKTGVIFYTMLTTCCSACNFPIKLRISSIPDSFDIQDFAKYRLSGRLEFVKSEHGTEAQLIVAKIDTDTGPETSPGASTQQELPKPTAPPAVNSNDATGEPGAAADLPAKQPRAVTVGFAKNGSLRWSNSGFYTLDELKAKAAREPDRLFIIRADKDVPYAKAIEVFETLKAAGATEIKFSEARVGDGRYRVANLTGSYEIDESRRMSLCQPSGRQYFTVSWPSNDGPPPRAVRLYPNVGAEKHGHWAVVWEPGTDALWWVDDSDVGKVTISDPVAIVVERESRTGAFSDEFHLPDGVVTEFRRFGFSLGGGTGEARRTREVLRAKLPESKE